MKESIEFFKTLVKSFFPGQYKKFLKHDSYYISQYYLSLIFIGIILLIIFAIPLFAYFPTYVSNKLSDFDSFKLNPDIKLNEQIGIPSRNPFVLFTPDNNQTIKDEFLLVSPSNIQLKVMFKENIFKLSDFTDFKTNAKFWGMFAGFMLVMILPMVMLMLYVFFVVKFLLIIFIFSLIVFLLAKALKFQMLFRNIFVMGIYASTVLVIPNMILNALRINFYNIEYAAYLIFFLVGMFIAKGSGTKKKNKHHGSDDDYIILKE